MEKTDAWQMIWSSVDYCRLTFITLGGCIWFGTLHDTSYKIHVACSQIGLGKYPCVLTNNLGSHQFKPVLRCNQFPVLFKT